METRRVTLASCVLDPSNVPAGTSTDLLWKCVTDATARWNADEQALEINGRVSFLSYLNLLSLPKLNEYCDFDGADLSITVKGSPFILRQVSIDTKTGDTRIKRLLDFTGIDEFATVSAQLDVSDCGELVSFEIESEGDLLLKSASYSTISTDVKRVDATKLLLATTTYKKDDDIKRNVSYIKKSIVDGFPELTGKFKMVVIDNGGTLDASDIETEGGEISLIESPNVGGAGGFTQGMMLAIEDGCSHVLLMDDDVFVLPEAIKRAYAIAALAKDEYRTRGILNGAMFRKENPNEQFEDVAKVDKDGTYRRIKPDYNMSKIGNVMASELTSVDVPKAYGAWWFSMIPTCLIEKSGLPLPVFVRCDDVEFGMRAKPRMMSIAGVCTWHDKFEGRMNYASDCYQYTRNFLIMNAVDMLDVDKPFMMRFRRSFKAHLRSLSYDGAEMMVEALEDYLRGPEFLKNANGALIMRANLKRNEKMDGNLNTDVETRAIVAEHPIENPAKKPMYAKVLTLLPYNGQRRHFRHHSPAPIYYWMGSYPGSKSNAHDTLIAVSDDGARYSIRRYDKNRYDGIMHRYHDAMNRYADISDMVKSDWAKAVKELTTKKSWDAYLKKMRSNEPERFKKRDDIDMSDNEVHDDIAVTSKQFEKNHDDVSQPCDTTSGEHMKSTIDTSNEHVNQNKTESNDKTDEMDKQDGNVPCDDAIDEE